MLQVHGSYWSCEQYLQFSKGKYVQVTLKVPDAVCGKTSRHVFYIHDILMPTEKNAASPRLVVAKYSFLADQLAFAAGSTSIGDKELLLHFQDSDQMAEEGDAE